MKIDIVVQGGFWPNTENALMQYSDLPFVNKVIFSTWKDQKFVSHNPKIQIVQSDKPENGGQCNLNLQIVSSLEGIKACESDFVLKVRSDQTIYKESLEMMVEFIKNKYDKISGVFEDNTIFTHGINNKFPYHPNDQILMGIKTDMVKLFSLPLSEAPVRGGYNYTQTHFQADGNLKWDTEDLRPNIYLGAHYCANFDEVVEYQLKQYKDYLVDKAQYREEAIKYSTTVLSKYFQSFPKIKLWWEKQQSEYPFEMYEPQGETYGS